jgi:hypothetical protein
MGKDLLQLLPNRGVLNGGLYCLRHRVAIILSSPAGCHPEVAAEPNIGHTGIAFQSTKTGLSVLLVWLKSSDTHPLPPGLGSSAGRCFNEDMGYADAIVFTLLALVDFCFLIYLRRVRARRAREKKMMRCLALAVELENTSRPFPVARRWPFQRAS